MSEQYTVVEHKDTLEIVKTSNTDVNKGSEYFLNEEEYEKLVAAAKTLQDRCIINLFLRCGLRRDEVRNLRIEEIDGDRSVMNLKYTKRMKRRTVPMPQSVLSDIKILIEGRTTGYVFTSKWKKKSKTRLSLPALNLIVARAGRTAGLTNPNPKLTGINPHLLRHTFARHFLKKGGRMEVLQKLLGHSSIQTTIDIYGKPSVGDIRKEFDEYGI